MVTYAEYREQIAVIANRLQEEQVVVSELQKRVKAEEVKYYELTLQIPSLLLEREEQVTKQLRKEQEIANRAQEEQMFRYQKQINSLRTELRIAKRNYENKLSVQQRRIAELEQMINARNPRAQDLAQIKQLQQDRLLQHKNLKKLSEELQLARHRMNTREDQRKFSPDAAQKPSNAQRAHRNNKSLF